MPFPKPYRFTSTNRPTTPGAAVNSGFGVMRNPTSLDQLSGVTNFSIGLPILTSATVEGTDSPFFTRFGLAVTPPQRHWAAKLAAWLSAAQQSTMGLGMPLPVITAPPDETPLFVAKMLYVPLNNFGAQRAGWWVNAASTRQSSPGSWIEIIPASEYTFPACQLLSEIQEHLLEVVNGGVSFGSQLWTTAEVLVYLNQRISRFLVETGIVQFRLTQAAPAGDLVYDLPADLIDLRRVAWTSGSTTTVLPRADSLQADVAYPTWDTTPATPQVHLQVPEGQLQIQVAPLASSAAVLDFIYVKDFAPVVADCSILPTPDEWVPFIKWGVLSDMLAKEGEANDPQRAKYAEQRWSEGVSLARLYMGTLQ